MLFSLVVAVFFLPHHFLIQVDSQSRNVTENFQGLLDAVVHNDNETIAKFVGELRESKRRLEEAFDTLKDEIQSSLSHHHRKHRHEIISAEHNVTTMKREAVLNVFDRAIFNEKLNRHLAAYTTDAQKISYLTEELAHAEKEICRLGGLIGRIDAEKEQGSEIAALVVVRCQMEYLERTLFPYELYRNPRSRYARWIIILRTKGTDREKYRKVVLAEYKKVFPTYTDREIEHLYANVMRDLYSDLPDASKGPHLNVDAVILKRVNRVFSTAIAAGEDEKKEEPARRYIRHFGLSYEPRYITAMVVLSTDMSFTEGAYKTGVKKIDAPSDLSCVLITAELHKDCLPNVEEADVNAFFPSNEQPTKVIISSAKKRSPKPEAIEISDEDDISLEWADRIIAKFKDCDAAINAFDRRQLKLKGENVHVELIPCPAEGSAAA